MVRKRRSLSAPALKILGLMLQDPGAEYYGLELGRRADVLTGTVYPLLRRWEDLGWLSSRIEDIDGALEGRPPRRLYRLSGEGERNARREIEEMQAAFAPTPRLWTVT
jgi:PadR family transcriptional regulator PadR